MVQREQLKKTPLFDAQVQNGGRTVAFSGWCMPIQYLSILGEAKAARVPELRWRDNYKEDMRC